MPDAILAAEAFGRSLPLTRRNHVLDGKNDQLEEWPGRHRDTADAKDHRGRSMALCTYAKKIPMDTVDESIRRSGLDCGRKRLSKNLTTEDAVPAELLATANVVVLGLSFKG